MNGTENRKRAFPLAYRHPRPKGKAVRYGWELPVLQQKFCALSVGARFLYILAANESAGKESFNFRPQNRSTWNPCTNCPQLSEGT